VTDRDPTSGADPVRLGRCDDDAGDAGADNLTICFEIGCWQPARETWDEFMARVSRSGSSSR